ncbi:MAG: TonB-dependent receptor [Bacteroidetes bacterium]|nr:TonB-dependent receptor [Bacteroidota bacterium]
MRSLLLVLGFLLNATSLLAQHTVHIHIRSNEGGSAVESAYVNVYQREPKMLLQTQATDSAGNVVLTIDKFPIELNISAFGYDKEHLVLESKPTSVLTIFLIKRFSSLNEVVVTGVAAPIKPQNALASYKIITAESIRSQGAITLNEALSTQLNINIGSDPVLGSSVRMQGISGDKVKVMVDGVALNGRENGNIDLGQINLANVQRVELVQGPMSIIYGSDALGGVINVIEKENRKPYELQATANYETIGKYNFNLAAARSWKKHTLSIGGGRNYFEGWKYLDTMMTSNGDTIHPQRNLLFKPKTQYLANLSYQYRAKSGFKLNFATDYLNEGVSNKGMISVYSPYKITAQDEYYHTDRVITRLGLEGKLHTGNWKVLNGYVLYKRVRSTYLTDMTTLNETLSSDPGVQDTSRFADITSRGIYQRNWGKLELTSGYDIGIQQGYTKKISGDDHAIQDYAAFAMVSIPFLKNEKLKVQPGLRAAYNTKFSSPLIPALNLLFNVAPRVQVRASYAKGFRAPSLKEMYLQFVDVNHRVFGNENLKPEVGQHVQFSLSAMVHKKNANYTQVMLTGYYNDVTNGIVLVKVYPDKPTDITYQYANQSRMRNTIGSLQVEGQQQNLHYMLGYSYVQTLGQDSLKGFGANEATGNLSYYWQKVKLNFSMFYKYTGAQPFLRMAIDGSANYDGRQPAYQMMDASIERKFLNKKFSITAGVKNIFNVQSLSATGLTQGGVHSGNGTLNFLPRSVFTTLRFTVD